MAVDTLKVLVRIMGVSIFPSSLTCVDPASLPKPFPTNIDAGTLFLNIFPSWGIIAVTPVFQHKGETDGWRWHKWGPYIGTLNPQYEYLDDENFGDDFEYVLCFELYKVKS